MRVMIVVTNQLLSPQHGNITTGMTKSDYNKTEVFIPEWCLWQVCVFKWPVRSEEDAFEVKRDFPGRFLFTDVFECEGSVCQLYTIEHFSSVVECN